MPKIKRYLSMFVIAGCIAQSSLAIAGAYKIQKNIHITNAIVYVPLRASQTTSAFFTIQNDSQTDIVITQVTSPSIKKIELISAFSKEPASANAWLISRGTTLTLSPQKQYLQLNGLINSLATGDELHLDVRLSNGATLLVIAHATSAFDQPHSH